VFYLVIKTQVGHLMTDSTLANQIGRSWKCQAETISCVAQQPQLLGIPLTA